METYLTMLYVTLEQEIALRDFFNSHGWIYCKPDLTAITDTVGPVPPPVSIKTSSECGFTSHPVVTGQQKSSEVFSKPGPKSSKRGKVKAKVNSFKRLTNTDNQVIKIESNKENDVRDNTLGKDNDTVIEEDGDNDDDYGDDILGTQEVDIDLTNLEQVAATLEQNNTAIIKTADVHKMPKPQKSTASDYDTNAENNSVKARVTPWSSSKKKNTAGAQLDEGLPRDSELKDDRIDNVQVLSKDIGQSIKENNGGQSTKDNKSNSDVCPCPVCGKLGNRKNQKRHMRSHENYKYKCGRCLRYFNQHDEYNNHMTRNHSTALICSYCGLKYKFKSALNEHIRFKHTGTGRHHVCDICGKRFSRIQGLEDHLNVHAGFSPYQCKVCGHSYCTRSAYKRHCETCEQGKNYSCDRCGRVYKSRQGLKDHIDREHKLLKYSCVCGEMFAFRSNRAKHQINCSAAIGKGETEIEGPEFDETSQNDMKFDEETEEFADSALEIANEETKTQGFLDSVTGEMRIQLHEVPTLNQVLQ